MKEDRPRSLHLILLIVLVGSVFLLWQGVLAQENGLRLLGFSFGSGGDSSGGDYRMQTVLGQAQVGSSSGGDYTLVSGFGGVIQQVATFSTPTVTVTPIAPDADVYEPDDSCTQAFEVQVDGFAQERNFHAAANVDWVQFSVTKGETYRIDAMVPADSVADVIMELHDSCSAIPLDRWTETFTRDAQIEFEAEASGAVFVKLLNNDSERFGRQVSYRLSVRHLVEDKAGAVIIVGGRYRTSDSLQPNINSVTDRVYDLFEAKNYTDDDIYYISTNSSADGYDASATMAVFRSSVVDWAADKVAHDRALTIYMMDHGDRDAFYLDWPNQQYVTPALLDEWLSTLESIVPGVPINVVIEACHAGSFIEGEQSISGPGRLIITSTNVDNSAYASATGAAFSDHFLASLWQDKDVFHSFWQASKAVQNIRSRQEPWLDANGDGIPNQLEDMVVASQRGFDNGSFGEKWPPLIASAQGPLEIIDNRGVIEAEVRTEAFRPTVGVTATIYSPSYASPDDGSELVPEPESIIELKAQGNNIYRGEYEHFDELGLYRIVVSGLDVDGLVAQPVLIEVWNGTPIFLPMLTAP